jgi:thiamine-monophosphate kinase
MIEDKTPAYKYRSIRRIWINRPFDKNLNHPSTLKSIGDDAAVLDFKNKKVVISTDLLIEGAF